MAQISQRTIEELRSKAAALEADAAALRRTVAVLEGRSEDAVESSGPTRKRARPSSNVGQVLKVIEADPDRRWDSFTLHDALVEGGWRSNAKDPVNAIRTALARLAERGQIKRVGNGEYQGIPDPFQLEEDDEEHGEPASVVNFT